MKKKWYNIGLLAGLMGMMPCYAPPVVVHISADQAHEIGKKIWRNECGGKLEGLAHWGAGEDFPSLGIGHFIWCPKNKLKCGIFKESFPALRTFLAQQGQVLPHYLQGPCPWKTREEFLGAAETKPMKELRLFLERTIDLQVRFIIQRFKKALSVIIKHAPPARQAHIKKQLYRVIQSPLGLYPLIDYVNFKGEGIKISEEYQGVRWGLLQVLDGMRGTQIGSEALKEFARSAKEVLLKRIGHAPSVRNEQQWWPGWKNRIESYIQ